MFFRVKRGNGTVVRPRNNLEDAFNPNPKPIQWRTEFDLMLLVDMKLHVLGPRRRQVGSAG